MIFVVEKQHITHKILRIALWVIGWHPRNQFQQYLKAREKHSVVLDDSIL